MSSFTRNAWLASFFSMIIIACTPGKIATTTNKKPADTGNSTNATRDNNLAMGNPGNASTSNDNNYLIIKPQYVLSYSRERSSANWVSWHLSSAWLGNAERTDHFRADETLPKDWYRVQSADYLNSGFDRGHLCPSGDRNATVADNDATFLMTNIVPQAPKLNRGLWADLETYCRKTTAEGNELYIIAGVHGTAGIGTAGGKSFTLDNGKIAVPQNFWKVIVMLPNGQNDLSRINEQTRIIAVYIPNRQTVLDTKWGEYRLSVDDLEKITGYDFLSNVPARIQAVIEADADTGPTEKVSVMKQ
ncbi:DNA/RNA non-specific endonuclease [Emticicia fluvialis]|uniref:DNA/RNA non-specific endonuclease n=1 Tax=Emticicia fluvialis TaxID=2974474 RepID=UPI002166B01B|nr:DNA/RNA non-specific endonuclease [Emticicia fluvialis]